MGLGGQLDVDTNLTTPVVVAEGGTGSSTLTDGAVLVGNGTDPVTEVGPLTDGQLLIGSTSGVDPVPATLTAPAAGMTITGGAGSITFALADDLAALEGLSGTGIVTRTAADTYTERSIAVTASTGLSVANGDGVAGNPTLAGVDADTTTKGVVELATTAEVTTGTDTARVPSVSAMIGHEGICKGWVQFDGNPVAINDSFNVSSVTDAGVGDYVVNWSTNFGSGNYAVVYTCTDNSSPFYRSNPAAGSSAVVTRHNTLGSPQDPAKVSCIAIGDR